ncbi:formyltetrahydrofolate deformylase [bacterium]
MKNNAILLLSCKDQKGIVASVANFIFKNDGNIINSDQHSDIETNTFFMRIEWELANFKIPISNLKKEFSAQIAKNFDMQFSLDFSNHKKNTAIFVSKYNHCLIDLLLRHKEGEINTDIKVIISNHNDLKNIADFYNIDFHHAPITVSNKIDQEKLELKILEKYNIDLIILARYMQILTSEIVSKYENKIINIHHSFLPAFIGAKPYKQAFERGVKIIGATSHYVTVKLDTGPIIEQDIIRISHKDTETNLISKGKDIEKRVLSKAVKLHLENKILVHGKKTIVFG